MMKYGDFIEVYNKCNHYYYSGWFHAVQALDLAGVCFGVLALLVTYAMLLTDRCKRSGTGALLNTASQLVGGEGFVCIYIN